MLPSAATFLAARLLRRDGVQWWRAIRAIRDMRRDPSRSELIFELNVALAGEDYERQYQSFLSESGAPALLAERPSLVDASPISTRFGASRPTRSGTDTSG